MSTIKKNLMRKTLNILLFSIVAICFVDTIGSIASRKFAFNYSYLSMISFLIYALTSFVITKLVNFKMGVLGASILGLFDSTIGWKISILLSCNSSMIPRTITIWIITIIIVTLMAAFAGLIGGGFAKIIEKKEKKLK